MNIKVHILPKWDWFLDKYEIIIWKCQRIYSVNQRFMWFLLVTQPPEKASPGTTFLVYLRLLSFIYTESTTGEGEDTQFPGNALVKFTIPIEI